MWVKTNQLQGLIRTGSSSPHPRRASTDPRTGRTGHWLNHSKEHCLVALRRSEVHPERAPALPSWFRKGFDTQVLLAEVRETSRKPDELYDIIERVLSAREDGGRKVELFGRTHNLRDSWSVPPPGM